MATFQLVVFGTAEAGYFNVETPSGSGQDWRAGCVLGRGMTEEDAVADWIARAQADGVEVDGVEIVERWADRMKRVAVAAPVAIEETAEEAEELWDVMGWDDVDGEDGHYHQTADWAAHYLEHSPHYAYATSTLGSRIDNGKPMPAGWLAMRELWGMRPPCDD